MEDAEIIDLYFARSETAIAETERKYGAYLNRIAYQILRDLSDVEEIVSDTYLRAWNAMPPTRPGILRHFLARITRNLSLDRLDYNSAKRRNRGETLLSELEECIPDGRGSAEEEWESKRLGEALNAFLAELAGEERAVLLSRYFYGMTVREIAKRSGLTERRVKYQLSRTRGALRQYLTREGFAV